MQSKKTYMILMISILVFFIVMFLTSSLPGILKNRNKATFIVGNHTIWAYQNQKWQSVTDIQEIQKLNWKSFQLYVNHENQGSYSLWHDDKWYAFDEEKNPFTIYDDFLAYDANYNVPFLPFTEEKVTDTMYVANVLKNHNISLSSKLTTATKISVDFDQDGELEDFYAISNAFSFDTPSDITFSFAFMVKKQMIYMIYEEILENDYFGACKPFYTGFLDADNTGDYELILSCGKYSAEEQLNILYKFSKDTFKIVISNE